MKTVEALLRERKREIDSSLRSLLRSPCPCHRTLYEAMHYSLDAGGKRIRPILFLLTLEELGLDWEMYLDVACAIECVHTYSLIHDDLPAVDNDDYRRGKLTNHKVYGSGMATMAGDGLLTFAFELLAKAKETSPALRCEWIALLAEAAGPAGMVGGQSQDIESEGKSDNLQALEYMAQCKTGCLLAAPIDMATASAALSPTEKKKWHNFGLRLGTLFQITDDILDAEGTLEGIGKSPHRDAELHKSTYVSVLGSEGADRAAQTAWKDALGALGALGKEKSILAELTTYIWKRNK